jgi:hypothetical protein
MNRTYRGIGGWHSTPAASGELLVGHTSSCQYSSLPRMQRNKDTRDDNLDCIIKWFETKLRREKTALHKSRATASRETLFSSALFATHKHQQNINDHFSHSKFNTMSAHCEDITMNTRSHEGWLPSMAKHEPELWWQWIEVVCSASDVWVSRI